MSSSPSPNRWQTILWVILALGFPTAFGLAWKATQDPLQVLGVMLAYGLIAATVGFIAKVWEQLQERWTARLTEALDRSLLRFLSGFGRRYRRHIFYRHRFFDVKGLSTQGSYTLELDQVFVELTIAPRPPHEASADPVPPLPQAMQGGHDLWFYLNAESLADQNLVVIGPPGSGKTTLLKHTALTLIAGRKQRRRWRAPRKLPILLFLRDHAAAIQEDPNLSLAQAVQDHLTKWDLEAPAGWFEARLKKGGCLVLLDGLDEVADPQARQQVVAWVQRQMEAWNRNRFIVTSQPYGYHQHTLNGVTVLQVAPFSREQVRRFVHKWYTANEIKSAQRDDPGVRQDARQGAEDLLRRLRNTPDLAELAVNPLLLTMIATVHRYKSKLPGRRVELYKEICKVFLGQRRQARGLDLDMTPLQVQRVLQPLAYHLMDQQRREASLDEALAAIRDTLAGVKPDIQGEAFLKKVENESGLLLERESGVYGFAHKTFQEYLAAVHVLDQGLEEELIRRVTDDWWHETIRLYAAQTDASTLIAACLADDPPAIPALILAIECGEEAREVQPAWRKELKWVLTQGVEDPDPERRRIVAEALLTLRLRRMVRVDEDRYVDPTLLSQAEYQLFLDEKRAQGEYYQPDHWQDDRFPPGQGREPVVGVRPADAVAFCDWLTAWTGSEWRYRLPRAGEFAEPLAQEEGGAGHWVQTEAGFVCTRPAGANHILSREWLEVQIEHDHDYALDHDHVSGLDHARVGHDFAFDLALVLDLERDRAVDLDFAFARASILDRCCDLDAALDLDFALDLVLALALGLTLEHICDLARDLDHSFARVCTDRLELARTLAHALVRDLDHVPNLALFRDRAIHLARYLDRDARYLDHTLASASVPDTLARTLKRDLVLARAFARALVRDFARGLGRILETRVTRDRTWRQEARSLVLVAVTRLLRSQLMQHRSLVARLLPGGNDARERERLQQMADSYLDLYLDLCILEARIAGELPAFEGIRLVRERGEQDE